MFIVFEGIDGSGKTTQINKLYNALSQRGVDVHITREPTEGEMGKLLRRYLTGELKADLKAIAALFAADRLDHINCEGGIKDHLSRGSVVLCDRYYLSSFAYQSVDCELDWIVALNKEAMNIARPDLHIFLDVDAKRSMDRVTSRGETELFEQLERQKQIRENFFTLIDRYKESENILVLDGSREPDEIAEDVLENVLKLINL